VRPQTGHGAFAWALLAPTLALAQPAPSTVEPGALALRWNDPNGLAPTTDHEFESRLSERLGHAAFDPAAAKHALSVTWQGSAEQCRVELTLLHEAEVEGTRLIESPSGDCRALLPALLTVAALLIESRSVEPPPEPPPPPPAPKTEPPAPRAPAIEPDREPILLASLGATLSSGLAPRLELGAGAVLVLSPVRYLRVGVEGTTFFAHQYGAAPGLSLEHDRAALVACGMPVTGSFGLGLCGSGAFHLFGSEGISLAHAQSRHNRMLTAGVALRAEWRLLRRLWWVGHVGADIAPRPLYFYYTPAPGGESILFRQQRVSPNLLLGLTMAFL
jgi:hypothetical protein